MLGIRKHCGVAIDLFQGDITTFFCDAALAELQLDSLYDKSNGGYRHVAIAVEPAAGSTADAPKSSFELLKTLLSRQPKESALRRVTFVLPNLEAYRLYQAALFDCFPEHS